MRHQIFANHFIAPAFRSWKTASLVLSTAVAFAASIGVVDAQSALDGFSPTANGFVNKVVVQADGKILIGGYFTTVTPNGGPAVTRNGIARLNQDGTLDTGFNPDIDGAVYSIALQPDGKILVGGRFTRVGTAWRSCIARLDATTGQADSFNPDANSTVDAFAVQADGKIVVGGSFTSIGGQPRRFLARLDPTTSLADSFDANADSSIRSIVLQSDGRILVRGSFRTIGGEARQYLARLDATSGRADSFNPNPNNTVNCIVLQPDGKILVGGIFSSIGGQMRNGLARLDPSTGSADSFNPNVTTDAQAGGVDDLMVQPDGKILLGGYFTSVGGQTRKRLARLDPVTALPDSFDPSLSAPPHNPESGFVCSIALQRDGKVLAVGEFTALAPNGGVSVARTRIARVETDGRVDQTLENPMIHLGGDPQACVFAIAVQPDGKVLIGGKFTHALGVTRNNIARLNSDGTLDLAFNPAANDLVNTIAVQPDGKILLGGAFTSIGGASRARIARVDANSGTADSFDPNANGNVYAIVPQRDGTILVAGLFHGAKSIGGEERNYIARLDSASGAADSFDPQANGEVYTLALQADGKILAGGAFNGTNSIGGQTRNRIARLDPASGLADSFDANASGSFVPGSNGRIHTIAVLADADIVVGGDFKNIGGQQRSGIARLDSATGAARSFNANANGSVSSVSVQADGKLIVGGQFGMIGGAFSSAVARLNATTGAADSFNAQVSGPAYAVALAADGKILLGGFISAVGGQPRALFARLSGDTPALQTLAVAPHAITWTRNGAGPALERVTFDYSEDNVEFVSLGQGIASGPDWTLTGATLPRGRNLYVRARGYYRGGFVNGSVSTTESVRNLFIPSLQLTAAVSRKTHGANSFDIPLPLSGEPGVECRSSGGAHMLVLSFSNSVVAGSAAVTAGTANVSGLPTFTGNTMTVNLTDVSDVQRITVTLSGVTDTFGQILPETAVSVNMLVGDINGSRTVNASDIGAVKAQSGAPVTGANFRSDVAVNGTINATDIGLVKSRSGQTLP